MSKNSIYDKIVERGENEAKAIIEQAREEARILEGSIIDEMQKKVDSLLLNNSKKNEDTLKSLKTSLEQSTKQSILTHKKHLIHEVFNKVITNLINMDEESYTRFILNQIKESSICGNEVIYVNKHDQQRMINLFSDNQLIDNAYPLNKLNSLLGNNYHLLLSADTVNILGGFIIQGDNYDVNNSFEEIINELEESMEKDIASVLFSVR